MAKAPEKDPKDIPEVVEFITARDTLLEFKNDHPEVFEMLGELTERYNTALEQADKACRQLEVSCGPFDLYQTTTKYNAEELYNAIGRDKFLAVGGKLETVTTYALDKNLFAAKVSQGQVDKTIADSVCKKTPCYHKPEKLVIP